MQGLVAAPQARPAAEGGATTGLPDISMLHEQALAASRREAARSERAREGMATVGHSGISVLIEEALAGSHRRQARGKQSAHVAADGGEAASGEMGLGHSIGVDAGRESEGRETSWVQEQSAARAGEVGVNQEAVAECEERTAAMGVVECMWGWRHWRVVRQGEPCPGGRSTRWTLPRA